MKLPKPSGYFTHHRLWHSKILHSSPQGIFTYFLRFSEKNSDYFSMGR